MINGSIVSVDMDRVGVMAAYCDCNQIVPLYTVQYTHSASLHCAVHTQCLSTLCSTHTVPLQTVQYTHSASLHCAVHTQYLSTLCSTHTHTRSQYAAITPTTSISTDTKKNHYLSQSLYKTP